MSERVLRQLYWKISKKTLQLTISYLGKTILKFLRISSSFKLAWAWIPCHNPKPKSLSKEYKVHILDSYWRNTLFCFKSRGHYISMKDFYFSEELQMSNLRLEVSKFICRNSKKFKSRPDFRKLSQYPHLVMELFDHASYF